MHYIDEGHGVAMLMVHGNPTWSFYFRRLIQHVSPTHRTIAVDHIGCGLSDKPAHYRYRLDQHIANLVDFVSELDLYRVTLVVHDWGGAIGLGAALRDLKRYRRFVLLNTAAFPPPYVPWRILSCRIPWLSRVAIQGLNLFVRAASRMATVLPDGLPEEARRGLVAPYDNWANRQAVYRFVADIPLSKNSATWKVLEDIESELPRLKNFPVKLIWGMRDWCFRPECLQRFQSEWPEAEVSRLPDAGHYVMEDAPEQVIREIDNFLAKDDQR